MPGVELADGSSGIAENSGGREFGSTLAMTLAFTFALEFAVLRSTAEPQPIPKLIAMSDGINNFFINPNITSGV